MQISSSIFSCYYKNWTEIPRNKMHVTLKVSSWLSQWLRASLHTMQTLALALGFVVPTAVPLVYIKMHRNGYGMIGDYGRENQRAVKFRCMLQKGWQSPEQQNVGHNVVRGSKDGREFLVWTRKKTGVTVDAACFQQPYVRHLLGIRGEAEELGAYINLKSRKGRARGASL